MIPASDVMSFVLIVVFVVFIAYLFFEHSDNEDSGKDDSDSDSDSDSDGSVTDIDFNRLRDIAARKNDSVREENRIKAEHLIEYLANRNQEFFNSIIDKMPEKIKTQARNGYYYAAVQDLDANQEDWPGRIFLETYCHYSRPRGVAPKYTDLLGAAKLVFDYLQNTNMSPFICDLADGFNNPSIYISWANQEVVDKCISLKHFRHDGDMFRCDACKILFPHGHPYSNV